MSKSTPDLNCIVLVSGVFVLAICGGQISSAQVDSDQAIVYFDFTQRIENRGNAGGELELRAGLKRDSSGRLEFKSADQVGELDQLGTEQMSRLLVEVEELTVGGWLFCSRPGEQTFISRGAVQFGPLGERLFPPNERYINFCLGTDERGFLRGTVNGNGRMPFVHGTINAVPVQTWQQLVVVKDKKGFHHFFQNGAMVRSDRGSMWAPSRHPWRETQEGEKHQLRLQLPCGGLIAEMWVIGRALTEEEVLADYNSKQGRYKPAPPGQVLGTREMYIHPPPVPESFDRERTLEAVKSLLGPFPTDKASLDPEVISEEDCGSYTRRKVSFQVQTGDRMPGYLLLPKKRSCPHAAVICSYGTTSGAGKDVTVGLSGRKPGTEPERNMSFALDLVEAGFVAFAPDYLRDGERVAPGDQPYDTRRFYEKNPDWSVHGKDIWDTMRAVDYLQSLDFVDPDRIGMVGHSYGGHSTIFTAALEQRIKVAAANGPVSAFREHGMHWAAPKGAGASQSLPAMRPFILNPDLELPVTFAQWTALIAPRPLLVGQAIGELRPREENNYGYVKSVYESLGKGDSVHYLWYAGDHDFPPEARREMVDWFDHKLRER